MNFKEIKNLMNQIFTNVVKVMIEISDINEKEIKGILNSYNSFNHLVQDLVYKVKDELEKIKNTFLTKANELNIEKLKEEIDTSVSKFMELADDLEILSLNTICKTKKLGKEKAVISLISDEIKKNSDYVKEILKKIKNNFYFIYDLFSKITSKFKSIKEVNDDFNNLFSKDLSNFVWLSDPSEVLQYSQFHDIFRQQLDEVEKFYEVILWREDSYFEMGKKLRFFEEALPILKEMREQIEKIMSQIIDVLRKFLLSLEKDVSLLSENISIIKESFALVNKIERRFLKDLEELNEEVTNLKEQFKDSDSLIEELINFKKSFYSLRVIAHVEVNRFGILDLYNLTESMDVTYKNLLILIDKVLKTADIWESLANGTIDIVKDTKDSIEKYFCSGIRTYLDEITQKNTSVNLNLERLKELLEKRDFVKQLIEYKSKLLNSLEEIISMFKEKFKELNKKILDIRSHKDFKKGYESLNLKKFALESNENLGVELF